MPSFPRSRPPAHSLIVFNVLKCHTPPATMCDRDAFNEAAALVTKVAQFSQNLKKDLEAIIEDFPGPAKLLQLVVNLIKNAVISGDGLCFAPKCGDSHVNSGRELDIAQRIPDLEILASHQHPR